MGLWKHQEGQEEQGAQVVTGIPWSGSLEPQKSGRTCREHGGDSGRHVVLGRDGMGWEWGWEKGEGDMDGDRLSPPHLTSPYPGYRSLCLTEVIFTQYRKFMQLLQFLCSYLLRESSSSHLAGSPVPGHLHSCTGPGEINFLFPVHSKVSDMFSLPDAFPGSLLRREDPVWRLLRLGPAVFLLGTEQPQAVPVIHCAVSIRKWQAQSPHNFLPPSRNRCLPSISRLFLLTSYTMNVSAEAIKVTSLQYLQLSNMILTPAGFSAEIYCVFQMGVIKTSSHPCPVVLVVVLCKSTN